MTVSDLLMSPNLIVMAVCMPIGLMVEALWAGSRPSLRSRIPNITYAVIAGLIEAAFAGFKAAILYFIVRALGFSGLLDLQFSTTGLLGSFANIVTLMFVADFFLYWMHRLEHRIPFLWQEHVVHHCDPEVDITTAPRLHVSSLLVRTAAVSVPMAVLFKFGLPEILWLSLLPLAWTYFIHLNVRLGFGPLWWLATSPQYHRVHHSLEKRHIDRNYAAFFPFWDIVFGTAVRPAPNEYPAVGVSGVQMNSASTMLAEPFRQWVKMLKRRLFRQG